MRTDQLDGETDWKLRLPVACTQRLPTAAVSHEIKMVRRGGGERTGRRGAPCVGMGESGLAGADCGLRGAMTAGPEGNQANIHELTRFECSV